MFDQPNSHEINKEIDQLVKELTIVQVEDADGTVISEESEFVEPIHLQVVCQRWWQQRLLSKKNFDKVFRENIANVDNALEEFYENAVHDAAAKTNTSEKEIREWCEYQLMTPSGIRRIVYQGEKFTEGMPNEVVAILKSKYLIRPQLRSGSVCIELTHDQLISPIKTSNERWYKQRSWNAKLSSSMHLLTDKLRNRF